MLTNIIAPQMSKSPKCWPTRPPQPSRLIDFKFQTISNDSRTEPRLITPSHAQQMVFPSDTFLYIDLSTCADGREGDGEEVGEKRSRTKGAGGEGGGQGRRRGRRQPTLHRQQQHTLVVMA